MNTARPSLLQTTISCSSNSNSISRSKRAAEKRLDRDEALGRGGPRKISRHPIAGRGGPFALAPAIFGSAFGKIFYGCSAAKTKKSPASRDRRGASQGRARRSFFLHVHDALQQGASSTP